MERFIALLHSQLKEGEESCDEVLITQNTFN